MIQALKKLEADLKTELAAVLQKDSLESIRIKYLGRKGLLAGVCSQMALVPAQERPAAGQELNRVKEALEALLSDKEKSFQIQAQGPSGSFDPTMPGTFANAGSLHPLTQVVLDITEIFERLGFVLVDGPEVETEYYNFEALNIALNHPARDSFDTFYLDNGKLLRSQTSTVQIRVMQKLRPPFKIIAPGKVYRPDATDATHSFMFHQIEGLCVDEGISFAHLKGVLFAFARQFFGPKTQLRFRPHFFPFTEPSAEIDIYSEKRGWLEILGAGMVHPNVLKAVKIDSERYTGLAFGMGVERMAMLKYGVEDIRQFFENDVRFLRQF
jgi:phenylalanyl-tRNA synthetase alpha chain